MKFDNAKLLPMPLPWQTRYGFTTSALCVHAPGPWKNNQQWQEMQDSYFADDTLTATDHPDLEIITWSNHMGEVPLLQRSAMHLGIALTVLRKDVAQWEHVMKIGMTYDYLRHHEGPEYVLQLDGDDVLLFGSPAEMIERFRLYECQMVLGNQTDTWPEDRIAEQFNQDCYGDSKYSYINSGSLMARRDYLLERLEQMLPFTDPCPQWLRNPYDKFSDQLAWSRMHLAYYPEIKTDVIPLLFSRLDTR
jgi:hypothetical protein